MTQVVSCNRICRPGAKVNTLTAVVVNGVVIELHILQALKAGPDPIAVTTNDIMMGKAIIARTQQDSPLTIIKYLIVPDNIV